MNHQHVPGSSKMGEIVIKTSWAVRGDEAKATPNKSDDCDDKTSWLYGEPRFTYDGKYSYERVELRKPQPGDACLRAPRKTTPTITVAQEAVRAAAEKRVQRELKKLAPHNKSGPRDM